MVEWKTRLGEQTEKFINTQMFTNNFSQNIKVQVKDSEEKSLQHRNNIPNKQV